MTHKDNEQEFAPHIPLDLTNQEHVLLALEELGVAVLQNRWVKIHEPNHADAPELEAQEHEFTEDIVSLFLGAVEEARLEPTGWAGASLVAHVRQAYPESEELDPRSLILKSLEDYFIGLENLLERDMALNAEGKKLDPKEYMDFMVAWSGFFCGKTDSVEIEKEN